jgi:hypothetical protein
VTSRLGTGKFITFFTVYVRLHVLEQVTWYRGDMLVESLYPSSANRTHFSLFIRQASLYKVNVHRKYKGTVSQEVEIFRIIY